MSKEFVPIYKYCELTGISRQNIYRMIRENKIDKEDFLIEEKVVKRLRINKDLKIEIRKRTV